MLIKSEFDIQFHLPEPTPMVAMLHVHPTLEPLLTSGDKLKVEHIGPVGGGPPMANTQVGITASGDGSFAPSALQNSALGVLERQELEIEEYFDTFGNRCSRFLAPAGNIRLSGTNVLSGVFLLDPQNFAAVQTPVEQLPTETLQYLLPSRYCQVDQFVSIAQDLFGYTLLGWQRAAAIRDWVHWKVAFNYKMARSTKTAMDVFSERVGVCRDFQHLAITLTRCMNIPARYVTGQLGDIRHPYSGAGDFSAWYQVWLDGKWWDMDARHNEPRLGRILMATGRDAADVALTTSFGVANLTNFYVESNEIDVEGNKIPLPGGRPETGAMRVR